MKRKPLFYLILFISMLFLGWWIGTQTVKPEQKRMKEVPKTTDSKVSDTTNPEPSK